MGVLLGRHIFLSKLGKNVRSFTVSGVELPALGGHCGDEMEPTFQ